MNRYLLIMFFFLEVLVLRLNAQDSLSHWSVVGKVGLDYYRVSPTSTKSGVNSYIDDMGWTFPGVAVEYTINPLIGFGGGVDYLTYNRNVAKGNTLDFSVFGSVNLTNLLAPKRTGFWSRANVYGTWGAGLGFFSNEFLATGEKHKLMSPLFTSALSFEYKLSKAWALQAEIQRRYYTREDLGGANSSENLKGGSGMVYGNDAAALTVGLRYKFGTKNKNHVRDAGVKAHQDGSDNNAAIQNRLKAIEDENAANKAKVQKLEAGLQAANAERAAEKAKLQTGLKDIPQAKVSTDSNQDALTVLLDVNFEFGSSELNPRSRAILDEVALVLKVNKAWSKLLISGHTDNIGGDKANKKLSDERAAGVKKYLISKGITASAIDVAGFGKEKPKTTNETKEGRYKNRRAELVIEK